MDGALETVHATAIAVNGHAALITGPSGAGKSDLALRCLTLGTSAMLPHAARLIADDRVILERVGDQLMASAPAAIAGKLEVRNIGIVEIEPGLPAPIRLVVELGGSQRAARLPDPWPTKIILGLHVPVLQIAAFDAAAPQKVMIALQTASIPAVC